VAITAGGILLAVARHGHGGGWGEDMDFYPQPFLEIEGGVDTHEKLSGEVENVQKVAPKCYFCPIRAVFGLFWCKNTRMLACRANQCNFFALLAKFSELLENDPLHIPRDTPNQPQAGSEGQKSRARSQTRGSRAHTFGGC